MVSTKSHVACSGATTAALTNNYHGESPQLDQLARIAPKPDVVTISIGGNDAKFADVVKACVWAGTHLPKTSNVCTDLVRAVTRYLPTLEQKLRLVYAQIHTKVPKAKIVVVGYPSVIGEHSNCAWLTPKNKTALLGMQKDLEATIAHAVKMTVASNTAFVSTQSATSDHELCTTDPYIKSISPKNVVDSYAAHPTSDGQIQMSVLVAGYMNSLN